MSNIASAVHIGIVNGHPVRFFAAPSGRLETPWEAADDLFAALGLEPVDLRDSLEVETPEGVVSIIRYAIRIREALLMHGFAEDEATTIEHHHNIARVHALEKIIGNRTHEEVLLYAEMCERNTVEAITGTTSH